MDKIKAKMIENNEKINWIPGHIKSGLFGKWLENARDWSISRNRYWGCPIPVWTSDDPRYPYIEVYGSIAELEEGFGVKIKDMHRPFIDNLRKSNPADPSGKSQLVRVPEILDCWFESGSMPFAQIHYPFDNIEYFEQNFPADFIVEYLAQTRGWFYTLMVLSTALFDRPPFLNCICHGVLLGEDGQKLSKRLQNYTNPMEIFEKFSSDSLRWFMLSSPVMKGQELRMKVDGSDVKKALGSVIKPFWNAYNFFTTYANADNFKAKYETNSQNEIDQYILACCMKSLREIKDALDAYDTICASKAAESFFDTLNNWYIRRSRNRFWSKEPSADKSSAYNTLFTVLESMSRALAPLLPMLTEEIFSGLYHNRSDALKSVHLADFPHIKAEIIDNDLIYQMDRVRDACTAALNIRNFLGIKVRNPLNKVTFVGVADQIQSDFMRQLILEEINVKNWENVSQDQIQDYADFKLKLNLPELAKRLPHKVKELISAAKSDNWAFIGGSLVKVADQELKKGEYSIHLSVHEGIRNRAAVLSTNDALVILDTQISEELMTEGIARDLVRMIQIKRKEMDLLVSQRISVTLSLEDQRVARLLSDRKLYQYICEQTLCERIDLERGNGGVLITLDQETVKN